MIKRELNWLIIAVTVVVCACSSTRPKENLQSIIPPFDSIAPSAALFEIDNSKDTLLELENGTSIQIPENCFVLKDGSVATENITIEFAQLNNPASIIASGIPMTYQDSTGASVQMESAGMFEIRGFANTEELEIREGKNIQVNLNSKVEGDYDFFYFEENELGNKGEWKVLEKNTLTSSEENKSGKTLKFDTVQNPETKFLTDVKWNISGINGNDTINWIFDETWNIVDVSKPKYWVKETKKIRADLTEWYWSSRFNSDSSLFWVRSNDSISIYDGSYELLHTFENKKYISGVFLKDNYFLAHVRESNDVDFYNSSFELMKAFDEPFQFHHFANSRTLAFINLAKSNSTHFYIDYIDYDGKLIRSIACKRNTNMSWSLKNYKWDDRLGEGLTRFQVSNENDLLAIISGEGVRVFDGRGKLLNTLENNTNFHSLNFLDYNDAIILSNKNNDLSVWDWRNNKVVKAPLFYEKEKNNWSINHSSHPTKPVVLLSKHKQNYFALWNWKSGTYTKHSAEGEIVNNLTFTGAERAFIGGWYGKFCSSLWGSEPIVLWNDEGELLLKINENDSVQSHLYIVDRNIVYIHKNNTLSLYSKGKLIKRISLIEGSSSGYLESFSKIGIFQESGNLDLYAKNGEFVSTIATEPYSEIFWYSDRIDGCLQITSPYGSYKLIQEDGSLECNVGETRVYLIKKNEIRCWDRENGVVVYEKIKAEEIPNQCQIILRNDSIQFIGRTDLDYETKLAIEEYQKQYLDAYAIKMEKRKEQRKAEAKVLRSFSVKKFGIYNWDRMYKRPNAVKCKLKLAFNTQLEVDNFSAFLITGNDKNTIIHYYDKTLENFAFEPNVYNQLLVVMPDNRIALFTNEDFKKLDTSNITEESLLTLQMKDIGKAESLEYLNELLN